ncbi:hypothetical protein QBC42DRAFT_257701 [Cladorrhinum samala]|uniref:Uncharacterized protein n=1 Tax=Cladorrhinum samala TaxID=585594 RepID=A0AAV9I1X7_9PEZI|nr:hypothetical protein QBC42DRAFT_257701 [Cladorrhinum samala]
MASASPARSSFSFFVRSKCCALRYLLRTLLPTRMFLLEPLGLVCSLLLFEWAFRQPVEMQVSPFGAKAKLRMGNIGRLSPPSHVFITCPMSAGCCLSLSLVAVVVVGG